MKTIGKIVNTQGIKGELRIISNSDFKDIRFKVGNTLYIKMKNENVEVKIINHYTHKNFDIIKIEGYNNINEVLKFKNKMLLGDELESDVLLDGEFFISDLLGLEVFNQHNEKLGELIDVNDNTPQTLLKVEKADNTSFLVPYVDAFILEINLDEKKIIINEIEGLV